MTPLTGWLADQIGRKRLFLVSIVCFTIASALCGLAQSLAQIVSFRLLQGLSGAALIPLSQAVLFDINPPERHGRAMSMWGVGVVLGPMLGPILGGWLTDNYSWRWVFYINVPFGVLAVLGILAYFPKSPLHRRRFDVFGFATLSVAVGTLQLLLDRGAIVDWFSSSEIRVYALVLAFSLYLFAVHTLNTEHPFIRLSLYRDRNFLTGNVLIFIVGIVLFATLALMPPMLQELMSYTALQAGIATAPRGAGTLLAMLFVGRLIGKIDVRLIIGAGFGLTALSLWQMTHFSMLMDMRPLIESGIIQGLGTGVAYVPMSTLAFATLAGSMRNEGTALFNLLRNIGSSVGIAAVQALLVRNTQVVHSDLAAHLTPLRIAGAHMPGVLPGHALAAINQLVTSQSLMIAYLDDFQLMFVLSCLSIPLLLLVRPPGRQGPAPHVAAE